MGEASKTIFLLTLLLIAGGQFTGGRESPIPIGKWSYGRQQNITVLNSIGNAPRYSKLQFHNQIDSIQRIDHPGGNLIYHGGEHSRTKRSAFCKVEGIFGNAVTGASVGEWQHEVR